ncbi:MAG TPA: aminotransferase class IV [Marinilabiliaceae bacterium]|nr:aminotransferase class IV [Marinilabiliaceae bacterium]
MKYIVHDGVLRHTDTFFVRSTNRAFRFGDGLFETIHYHKGKLLFWNSHYNRMAQGMAALRFFRGGFPLKEELKAQVLDLLVKNRVFNDARVRISLFRKGEGLYTPDNLSCSWLIEVKPMEVKGYQWFKEGVHMGLYTDFPRHFSPASPFKTLSIQANILAGIYAQEHRLQDAFVINGKGRFIESVSSNIFWIKEDILFTPAVSSGCVDGIMRKEIIRLAKAEEISVMENQGATKEELFGADELFLTNVISGIRWVAALQNQRFYSRVAKVLYERLCQAISTN